MEMVEEYLKANKLQFRDATDITEEFSRELAEMQGRCLDIGCGPGDVTKELVLTKLPPEAEVVGADISKPMIDHAKKEYHDNKRLSFIQLDIETANLSNMDIGLYDNAVSFYCLHWCQNTWRAFENIYKLLRPGGRALFMFLAYNDAFDAYVRIHDNPRYQPYLQDARRYVPYFHRCNDPRGALRKMLEDVGFEILHCSKREKSFVFQNLQIFKSHALAVNPFLSRIPDNLKKEFEDVIIREFLSGKIMLPNKDNNEAQEYSILDRYHILVTHIRKPQTAC